MNKSQYTARKAMHRCVQCGQMDAYTINGRAYCADCTEWRREYYRARGHRPDVRAQMTAHAQDLRDAWRSEGRCPRCGRPTAPPYVQCARCRAKRRTQERRYYRRTHPLPAGAEDLCARCHKAPRYDGHKLCAKCYADTVQAIKRATESKKAKRRATGETVCNG